MISTTLADMQNPHACQQHAGYHALPQVQLVSPKYIVIALTYLLLAPYRPYIILGYGFQVTLFVPVLKICPLT